MGDPNPASRPGAPGGPRELGWGCRKVLAQHPPPACAQEELGGHRAAPASGHSARTSLGPQHSAQTQPLPSGSPRFSLLTFTATVTTLSCPHPIFHSLLPLIQSPCSFKLFFFPPIHFPDASILFSCLALLLSSCYANKHEAEKGASLCRAGEERKTPEPSKC